MILRDLDLLAKRFLPSCRLLVGRDSQFEDGGRSVAVRHNPKRILRVLRAFQNLTRSARSISVNSGLRFFPPRRTQRQSLSQKARQKFAQGANIFQVSSSYQLSVISY